MTATKSQPQGGMSFSSRETVFLSLGGLTDEMAGRDGVRDAGGVDSNGRGVISCLCTGFLYQRFWIYPFYRRDDIRIFHCVKHHTARNGVITETEVLLFYGVIHRYRNRN